MIFSGKTWGKKLLPVGMLLKCIEMLTKIKWVHLVLLLEIQTVTLLRFNFNRMGMKLKLGFLQFVQADHGFDIV